MKFSKNDILELTERVKERLSEKRFNHTLSVVEMAKKIGMYFDDIDSSELCSAALLHDITKELSYEEHIALLTDGAVDFSDEDMKSSAILHSLSAPVVIRRDFSEFATDSVLSAVEKHTTGSDGMTLFDKIIFIADYVEDTRIYESCISVRKELFSNLSADFDCSQNEHAVNKAVFDSLTFTENQLIKQGRVPNSRSLKAKNYIAALLSDK